MPAFRRIRLIFLAVIGIALLGFFFILLSARFSDSDLRLRHLDKSNFGLKFEVQQENVDVATLSTSAPNNATPSIAANDVVEDVVGPNNSLSNILNVVKNPDSASIIDNIIALNESNVVKDSYFQDGSSLFRDNHAYESKVDFFNVSGLFAWKETSSAKNNEISELIVIDKLNETRIRLDLWESMRQTQPIFNSTIQILSQSQLRIISSLAKKEVDNLLLKERMKINKLISDTAVPNKLTWTRISYTIARLGVPHTNLPKSKAANHLLPGSTDWWDSVTQLISKEKSCWSLIEYSSVSAQSSIAADIALQYPFSIVLHVEIMDPSEGSDDSFDPSNWNEASKHARSVVWSENDWSLQNLIRFKYSPSNKLDLGQDNQEVNDDLAHEPSIEAPKQQQQGNPLFLLNLQAKCDLIVISDLTCLSFNVLPTEFEYFLGRLILQGYKLIVPAVLPSNEFFSLWSSVSLLIKSSVSVFSKDTMQVDSTSSALDGITFFSFSEKIVAVEPLASYSISSPYSLSSSYTSKYSSYGPKSFASPSDEVNTSYSESITPDNAQESVKIACPVVPTLLLSKLAVLPFGSQLVMHPFDKSWLNTLISQFSKIPDILELSVNSLKQKTMDSEIKTKPLRTRTKQSGNDDNGFDWFNPKLFIDDIIKFSTPQSPTRLSENYDWNDVALISKTWSHLRPNLDEIVTMDDDVPVANNDSKYWTSYDDNNDGNNLGGFFAGSYSGSDVRPAKPLVSSTSTGNYKYYSTPTSKYESIGGLYKFRFRSLAAREETYSSIWWPQLEQVVLDRSVDSVLLLGSRISLLSVKLAESIYFSQSQAGNRIGIIISHLLHELDVSQHLHLLRLKRLKNNVICASRLTLNRLISLSLPCSPQFNVVLLDDSVFWEAVRLSSFVSQNDYMNDCSLIKLEVAYGMMISWGQTSFLHVPKIESAARTLSESNPRCAERIFTKYANDSSGGMPEFNFIQRSIASASKFKGFIDRKLFDDNQSHFFVNLLSNNEHMESATIIMFKVSQNIAHPVVHGGVSLHQIFHRGPVASVRKQVYSLLLQVPLWSLGKNSGPINPWETIYSVKALDWSRKVTPPVRAVLSFRYSSPSSLSPFDNFASSYLPHLVEDEVNSMLIFHVVRDILDSRLAEQDEGLFSFLELGSNTGTFSMLLAKEFQNATVLSVADDADLVRSHASSVISSELFNNVVCHSSIDSDTITSIYESPELFRFQSIYNLLANEESRFGSTYQTIVDATGSYQLPLHFAEEKIQSPSSRYMKSPFSSKLIDSFGEMLAKVVSNAVTTFLVVPTPQQISFAFSTVFPNGLSRSSFDMPLGGSIGLNFLQSEGSNDARSIYYPSTHPFDSVSMDYGSFFSEFGKNVAGGKIKLIFSQTTFPATGSAFPLLRIDLQNLTRPVHHHYGYSKDGHTRTYTMKVEVNDTSTKNAQHTFGSELSSYSWKSTSTNKLLSYDQKSYSNQLRIGSTSTFNEDSHVNNNQIVQIYLVRDKDNSKIPYIHLNGFTMIAALRMGLEERLASRSFVNFLKLPMHEDMAPWNIMFAGKALQYIDYDTRDVTFEDIIPRAFQVMEVLMNYKRTVSDLNNCGGKANVEYGIPYVGDCVSSSLFKGPCKDKEYPVPCGDHKCHSDFVSCLRSVFGVQSYIATHAIDGDISESEYSVMEVKRPMMGIDRSKSVVEFG